MEELSEEEDEDDETKMSLDEFVEVLNEINTNPVGRTLLLSLMHMKGNQPRKKRISFNIPDVFNMLSQLPAALQQQKPVFDTVVNLLQGKGDDGQIDEELIVKMNQSLLLQLLQIRDSAPERNSPILEVNEIMKKYRSELQSEWTAGDASDSCAVNIMDFMWTLSMISSKEDRKFLLKNVIINALKELEHIKIVPQRPIVAGGDLPAVGKQEHAQLTYAAEQAQRMEELKYMKQVEEQVTRSRVVARGDLQPGSMATARTRHTRDRKLYSKSYKVNNSIHTCQQ